MLCFEVYVNDKKVCTAGHEELDKVITSLTFDKDKGTVILSIDGQIFVNNSLSGYAQWFIPAEDYGSRTKRKVKIGDEIRIISKRDVVPDKPMIYRVGKQGKKSEEDSKKVKPLIYCSFCSKEQKEVKKVIAGPEVYICNECIDLCNEIIEDENKS